jgi:hypothetical protein
MSRHRTSREPSQGGTTPRTAAPQVSGVAQLSMSEVAQFSVSLDTLGGAYLQRVFFPEALAIEPGF